MQRSIGRSLLVLGLGASLTAITACGGQELPGSLATPDEVSAALARGKTDGTSEALCAVLDLEAQCDVCAYLDLFMAIDQEFATNFASEVQGDFCDHPPTSEQRWVCRASCARFGPGPNICNDYTILDLGDDPGNRMFPTVEENSGPDRERAFNDLVWKCIDMGYYLSAVFEYVLYQPGTCKYYGPGGIMGSSPPEEHFVYIVTDYRQAFAETACRLEAGR